MKFLVPVLALFILFTGCRSARVTSVNEHTTVKDSTVVTFKPVDTIIRVPSDSISVRIPIKLLTETPVVKSNERTSVSISKVGEDIKVECHTKELEKKIRLLNKIIENHKNTVTVKTETIIQEVKYVPWYVKILAWLGAIAALFLGWKLFRFIQSFTNPIKL